MLHNPRGSYIIYSVISFPGLRNVVALEMAYVCIAMLRILESQSKATMEAEKTEKF